MSRPFSRIRRAALGDVSGFDALADASPRVSPVCQVSRVPTRSIEAVIRRTDAIILDHFKLKSFITYRYREPALNSSGECRTQLRSVQSFRCGCWTSSFGWSCFDSLLAGRFCECSKARQFFLGSLFSIAAAAAAAARVQLVARLPDGRPATR